MKVGTQLKGRKAHYQPANCSRAEWMHITAIHERSAVAKARSEGQLTTNESLKISHVNITERAVESLPKGSFKTGCEKCSFGPSLLGFNETYGVKEPKHNALDLWAILWASRNGKDSLSNRVYQTQAQCSMASNHGATILHHNGGH